MSVAALSPTTLYWAWMTRRLYTCIATVAPTTTASRIAYSASDCPFLRFISARSALIVFVLIAVNSSCSYSLLTDSLRRNVQITHHALGALIQHRSRLWEDPCSAASLAKTSFDRGGAHDVHRDGDPHQDQQILHRALPG